MKLFKVKTYECKKLKHNLVVAASLFDAFCIISKKIKYTLKEFKADFEELQEAQDIDYKETFEEAYPGLVSEYDYFLMQSEYYTKYDQPYSECCWNDLFKLEEISDITESEVLLLEKLKLL